METITRASIELEKRARNEKAKQGQQLFAKIKRTSKYFGQTEKGALFEVFVEVGHPEGYVVKGGPGGQYRLTDVQLFVVDGPRELRIA